MSPLAASVLVLGTILLAYFIGKSLWRRHEMSNRLAASPRWGWLSARWMLPWRYRAPALVGLFAIAYASLEATDAVDDPAIAAMVIAALLISLFDLGWWSQRSRP